MPTTLAKLPRQPKKAPLSVVRHRLSEDEKRDMAAQAALANLTLEEYVTAALREKLTRRRKG